MRVYQFTPKEDMRPVFTIKIETFHGVDKIKTVFRDQYGHFSKARSGNVSEEVVLFFNQLAGFWKNVCKYEDKGNPGMSFRIIETVQDADLKEFLNKNSI